MRQELLRGRAPAAGVGPSKAGVKDEARQSLWEGRSQYGRRRALKEAHSHQYCSTVG